MSYKNLLFFIGRLGSGKTYVAKQYEKQLQIMGYTTTFIEVSSIMNTFLPPNPTREQKQELKEKLKNHPRFLIDSLIEAIKKAPTTEIIISGLREYWIYDELQRQYSVKQVFIVNAPAELRRKRRGYTEEEFKLAEERDDKIGVGELIEKLTQGACVIQNIFEQ
jgi:hypothetical protein